MLRKWTTKKPTKPGWYWCRTNIGDSMPSPVFVDYSPVHGLTIGTYANPYAAYDVPLADWPGEWWSCPIVVPE